jgi:hypothetical protein
MVTAADVARVRRETAARKALWTIAELEASLPRPLDPQQWKLSASHAPAEAPSALTLRGWSSGVPQAAGMWFQVELPQPVTVTEVQFDSASVGGAGGRGGRGAQPADAAAAGRGGAPGGAGNAAGATGAPGQPAAGATTAGQPVTPGAPPAAGQPAQTPAAGGRGGFGGPATPPIVGYPRGYSVQASLDGKTWSKALAEGKGEGARTIVAFPPTRARFLRITQTATVPDAPNWSVNNLRIYEAPGPAAGTAATAGK